MRTLKKGDRIEVKFPDSEPFEAVFVKHADNGCIFYMQDDGIFGICGLSVCRKLNYDHHIKVWPWRDAPEEYRELSENGGDEDWLAFIPEKYNPDEIGWMDRGTVFGSCCIDDYLVPGGIVRIGAHG